MKTEKEELIKKDFEKILNIYNLGRYKDHKYYENILQNDVYQIVTSKEKFILKLLKNVNLKSYEDQLEFLDYLSEKDVRVAKNFKDIKGNLISRYKNQPIIIQEFLEGIHPKRYPDTRVKDIANKVGIMHKTLLNSKYRKNKKGHNYRNRKLSLDIIPEEVRKINKENVKLLKSLKKDKLRVVRIHSDITEGNILVHKNKLTAFIDFDDSDYDYIVYELAIFIAHSFIRSKTIHKKKIKLFLNEYQKVVRLNEPEKKILYPLIVYRLIGIIYWHIRYIKTRKDKSEWLIRGINRSSDRLLNFYNNLPENKFTKEMIK
jgi:homoserine kinase type II